MREVVYFLAASLDGYIAREDGSVDWLKMEDLAEAGDEFMEFAASVDAVLFGRKTYEKGLELDEEPEGSFAGYTNYVFSRTPRDDDPPGAKFIDQDPVTFVTELKNQEGKNIWLMGGGELAGTLLNAGLVDEMVLSIQPVILGRGIPIFKEAREHINLKVEDIKHRKSGSVQVSYRIK